jgi:hypothetical protein
MAVQSGKDLLIKIDQTGDGQFVIDFIGIDNYMPLSDWRDGEDHADSFWGSPYSLDYLQANIEGGEGFDWFYDSPEGAAAQRRVPITDGAYGEPWVFRYKDLRSWWSNLHFDRIAGVRSEDPTAWVPASKPFRFTEYGAPAVDKGTNQPNKFVDPKSSESGLPAWSNGRRDDLVQMQYLLAVTSYWSDPARNPLSQLTGEPMVDISRAHAWAWDARPFPEFPGLTDVWSDGDNYSLGHWLNGRATNQSLASVIREICSKAGLEAVDTTAVHGVVRGYQQGDITTGRAAVQPLLLAYGVDAAERDGRLRFASRTARATAEVTQDDLVVVDDLEGRFEITRSADIETAGQVRLGYVDAQSSYEIRSAEARFPDEEAMGVSQTDLPLALTRNEGVAIVERWLAEARVARDALRLALPKSRLEIGAGDVIRFDGRRYRIDRVDQAEAQVLEALRVEAGIYEQSDATAERIVTRGYTPTVPVFPVFLDLPLLTGEEVPHAPHVAVAAEPWPGAVGVWSSSQDNGYALNRLVASPAVVGFSQSPLDRARPGAWDKGPPLRVRLSAGDLSSASQISVLNGANVAAIGDGSAGNWEVFQFAEAQLVAPDTYDLSVRLRGQAGTDGLMPDTWPIGSMVVLLDLAVTQIDLALSVRGLERYYRIGVASRGFDDPNALLKVEAFAGAGLRPYPVSHLRVEEDAASNLRVTWKRRTRIDGDTWQSVEVPLGEDLESYLLRVVQGAAVRAEYAVGQAEFVYSPAMRSADLVSGAFSFEIAQVSSAYGPGPFRTIAATA